MDTDPVAFGDDPEFDVTRFKPKPKSAKQTEIPIATIEAVAKDNKFLNREPINETEKERAGGHTDQTPLRNKRVYRTGRSEQFAVKVTRETKDAFYEIADRQGWVMGELLDNALSALKRELAKT